MSCIRRLITIAALVALAAPGGALAKTVPATLAFDVPVESTLAVVGQADQRLSVTRDPADDHRLIAAGATPDAGPLRWRVLARDGRILTDDDPTGAVGSASRAVGRIAALCAWSLMFGIALLAVAGPWKLRALLVAATAGIGVELTTAFVRLRTGDPQTLLLQTGWGRATLLQILGVLVVALGARSARTQRPLVVGGSGLGLVGLAAGGHAATGDDPGLAIAISSAHGLAGAAWVGGIAGLFIVLRRGAGLQASTATVLRLSTIALVSVAAVVVTGTYRSLGELGNVGALLTTGYGIALLVKLVLVVGLLVLGAVNRFVVHPRLERASVGLSDTDRGALQLVRRTITIDLVVGILVLGVAGLLGVLAPPR